MSLNRQFPNRCAVASSSLLSVALALALTGCGGANRDTALTATTVAATTTATSASTSTTATTTTAGSGSTDTGVADGGPLAIFDVLGIGYNAVTITVQTNSVLKLTYTPEVQTRMIAGTGYVPQYSQMGVYIKVGTTEYATALLRLADSSRAADHSAILDFSGAFTHTCAATDKTCTQSVTVTIYKPNSDYDCFTFGPAYCPYQRVRNLHPWAGSLSVQTDLTRSL